MTRLYVRVCAVALYVYVLFGIVRFREIVLGAVTETARYVRDIVCPTASDSAQVSDVLGSVGLTFVSSGISLY